MVALVAPCAPSRASSGRSTSVTLTTDATPARRVRALSSIAPVTTLYCGDVWVGTSPAARSAPSVASDVFATRT